MSENGESRCPFAALGKPSRRGFLAALGGVLAAAGTGAGAGMAVRAIGPASLADTRHDDAPEPFWGKHQAGIVTRAQKHTYFAVFDLVAKNKAQVVDLLQRWTEAAAQLTAGQTLGALNDNAGGPASDTADALNLTPSRLTLTFGLGAGLFSKDGQDRYGLAAARPAALVDMPKFMGDEFAGNRTDGDLSVQACANDPQVVFHAIRQLARLADGVAVLRWTQTGFLPDTRAGETPRNLMGFKDGTESPLVNSRPTASGGPVDTVVWTGSEAPAWMQGGSYMVVRRIRMALEHWDKTEVDFQEQVIGRHKYSGAPLGGKEEFDKLQLDANDPDGNPIIPENAHVRLATAETNDGARILRRGYSYNDGTNVIAERWPPWRQGLEYDAGLLFISYQRDPRTGFIKIFDKMAKFDMLNQYTTHTGSGLFAIPGGVKKGSYIAEGLFA
jgi:deferrochelatase/peroxidase EfeB